MVKPESPLIAAANNSDNMDFAVPGSPTSISPCLPNNVTIARSTKASSPKNFAEILSDSSPKINCLTARGERSHPCGFGFCLSASVKRANSSAKRISALSRRTFPCVVLFLVIPKSYVKPAYQGVFFSHSGSKPAHASATFK